MLQSALAGVLAGVASRVLAAAPAVVAVRVWPAQAYTRVTLESTQAIRFSHLMVPDPWRLVLDLEGVDLGAELAQIGGRVGPADPYISQLRAGRFKPGTTRVVFDLKSEVRPQVFALEPHGDYQHRLVVDLYPVNAEDGLLAMLQERDGKAAPERSPARNEPRNEPRNETTRNDAARNEPARGEPETVDRKKLDVNRMVTVVLDPGHGGEDPGAIGAAGTYEKHVTLAIANRLKRLIDSQPNMRAVLTRDDDYFVPLAQRVVKARKVNADLFMSIHADAFVKPNVRGSSVFALSERGATSTAAKWLAQTQNESDLMGGVRLDERDPYLARTLFDLTQTATINDSLKLGKAMLSELGEINHLHKPDVEQAGFAVLKAPDIPSILVETAFISNPEEEKRLNDQHYQEKMAKALLSGIRRYLARNPPLARNRLAGL